MKHKVIPEAQGKNSMLLFILDCMGKEPRDHFQSMIVCNFICGALQAGYTKDT